MKKNNGIKPKVDINLLIRRLGELPPAPQVAQKALKVIKDPNSNMTDLARVMSLDQAMAAMVLHWANSAYFSPNHTVSTIQQAVSFLGHVTVRSLILTAVPRTANTM